MIILNVWSHNIQNCAAATKAEKKDILIGGAKLLVESKLINHDEGWKGLLIALIPLTIDSIENDAFTFNEVEQDEIKSFDTTYSKLSHSSIYNLDVTATFPSGSLFLAQVLSTNGEQFIPRIQQLSAEQQRAVQTLLQKR